MFIFPMMGKSSRFFNAGYTSPKYRLLLGGRTLFDRAVSSFSEYFQNRSFVFVVPSDGETASFVRASAQELGIIDVTVVELEHATSGQGETVAEALRQIVTQESIYIFNIDTILTNFVEYNYGESVVGALDVFEADGEHWSFVIPGAQDQVAGTREKVRVSDLCSNGLYWFRSADDYLRAFDHAEAHWKEAGETYIAPMYNVFTELGEDVRWRRVPSDWVLLAGTPDEYEDLARRLQD